VAYCAGTGRVWTIYSSNADFDRSRVAVLGRGNGCCIRLRRGTAVYLFASAIIALTSAEGFSKPAHKQAASHRNVAAKAENHKHRVATHASHRDKTAKVEKHKRQSQTEEKHSERAPGPRILLPRDLWAELSEEQRDTLLLHELAHLRRRDHWVRRLELVVLGLYWWLPVAWWACRCLHEAEEECCDAWVIEQFPATPRRLVCQVCMWALTRPGSRMTSPRSRVRSMSAVFTIICSTRPAVDGAPIMPTAASGPSVVTDSTLLITFST